MRASRKRVLSRRQKNENSLSCKALAQLSGTQLTSSLSPNNDIPLQAERTEEDAGRRGVETKAIRRQEKENNDSCSSLSASNDC
jgi:hypothetical protein